MQPDVLIAAELRELVGDDPVPGHAVRWFAAGDPVPAGPYTALVPLLSRPIAEAELSGLPALRVVANCAVGVNNIDLAACTRRGIIVTNTPDVLTESTADLTWLLILAAARRVKEGMQLLERNQWTGWHPTLLLGIELKGRTLGLVGAGRIGQAVARRAGGFGMHVLYNAPTPKPEFEREVGAQRLDLPSLLQRSDVISLHLPLTQQTHRLFDRTRFFGMRLNSVFINTSRGELVDEAALLEALDRGHLAAAGLDVFWNEPHINRALVGHPRVVALPHVGSATQDTRRAMAALAVGNVRAVLAGQPALTPV
ncbi:MAG TPA: D-glycerate dehydrogenase [Gemmatimonadales bacterium]|nr:D-glycerate dehydrogenase [Gemmatimonadales bacterium]